MKDLPKSGRAFSLARTIPKRYYYFLIVRGFTASLKGFYGFRSYYKVKELAILSWTTLLLRMLRTK